MFKKIRNAKIKLTNRIKCFYRRLKIKNKDFSIISNNCWGGFIYQYFGLEYSTPTIGLFIYEKDYIKFCKELKHYLSLDLEFIDVTQSKYYDKVTQNQTKEITYPIAKLGDIEVFFMHYHSIDEAIEKWERRKSRINYDRLLFKMSERNDCDMDTIRSFCELQYNNKICFTHNKYVFDCCVYVEEINKLNVTGGDETPYTLKNLDLYKVLNDL